MWRCPDRVVSLVSACVFAAFLLEASPLLAEPKDSEAQELAKKAIYTDYLGTRFEDAEKKLTQALGLCGDASCSKKVKAQLHRDLGVVYVGGMNRLDEGKTQFSFALKADRTIALDADLVSPEIEAAFAEARKAEGLETKAPAAGSNPTNPTAPPAAPSAGQGDMVHTPAPEQVVLTPVPIYAELPQGVAAAKVQVSYKPFGATEWKTVTMKRIREGYGVEVPCLDVGSATGVLRYYIQAFDAENNLVSWSGTRNAPREVPLVAELKGDPPHLPGQPPSAKCTDTGDCPPEFPGCHSNSNDGSAPCEGSDCADQGMTPGQEQARKNWFSLALQQDVLFLPSATNSCSGNTPYDCFRDDGSYYELIPYDKSGGEISGGASMATTRILLGYDRRFGPVTAGVRLGFAFGGGPQAPGGASFFPLHAEARVSYWFGSDPFARKGLRPYVTLGGGVAQIDSEVSVAVYDTKSDFIADKRNNLGAWRKAGIAFLSGGVGVVYALTHRMGPFAELHATQMLGASGTGMGVQLGYSLGL